MSSSPISLVKTTTQHVIENATHVSLNRKALIKTCSVIAETIKQKCKTSNSTSLIESLFIEWDNDTLHYRNLNEPELTCQYILVLSSINFCFWPLNDSVKDEKDEFEYGHLASGLRSVLQNNPNAFSSEELKQLTSEKLTEWFNGAKVPLLSERVRLIREVGFALEEHFDGKAFNLIKSANKSVNKLVSLVTQHFPGFRDHCIYSKTGHQIHFYKRAQIFCADIYGCFKGQGIGQFDDINDLTMFADYRVPQLLNILVYSDELKEKISNLTVLEYSSQMEVEIRAFTIQAVEEMRKVLLEEHSIKCLSIEIDWMLWQIGEANRKTIRPHHRTLSVYY
ncbi:predicted protein [Naegleria gruberi]|uniref:Queuosine 5'-phosphate N-glycosylase/hydrolase n=1 Tax=Naegleria gruberi TaxID=5762 RepID=D2V6Q9_NAEGR|nr:uncharacterized protein NAEGRDRAFT_31474 [Naegleria gruberi]EFC47622.1 predicted protein [Naegleria gruberi]|eukprot:XP_002680366.1 predicted protein [Naegleria gruberi strain NEG-M]